jgi:hypothetical protein
MKTGFVDPADGCLYCHRPASRDFCSPDCRTSWWMDLNDAGSEGDE